MNPTSSLLPIQLSIYNNFFTPSELISLSRVNKELSELSQKFIDEYKKNISKIYNVKIIENTYRLYSFTEQKTNTYDLTYWYNIFGRKLNIDELAIYYSYFIVKYLNCCGARDYFVDKFNKRYIVSYMNLLVYEDGYIMLLPSKYDGSISLNQNLQSINPNTGKGHYSYIQFIYYNDLNDDEYDIDNSKIDFKIEYLTIHYDDNDKTKIIKRSPSTTPYHNSQLIQINNKILNNYVVKIKKNININFEYVFNQ